MQKESAATQHFGRLVVIGVGLIGGSLALDLKRANAVSEVIGVGRSLENMQRALQLGVIDRVVSSVGEAVSQADMVLIATPVGQMASVLEAMSGHLAAHAVVTDAGSTKSDVVALFRRCVPQYVSQCVPAHPIAGSDLSGAAAARYGLYRDKNVILAPLDETTPEALQRVEALWDCVGARTRVMSAEAHDAIFAAVSHVPHLLAFAYMNMLSNRGDVAECLRFAGSGFRDFSRIAGSHPEMWRDIALSNREALLMDLAQYREALEGMERALQQEDGARLLSLFREARHIRATWGAEYDAAR